MIYTDTNFKSEFAQYLDPQERLIWAGKPKGGFRLQMLDIFLIPFSLVFCGFSIFWMIMASQASIFFALFGIPFVIVGLFLVFGRFIYDKNKRESTTYGLTQERILIKSGKMKVQVQSFSLSALPDIDLVETSDGRGTISFGPKNPMMERAQAMGSFPGMKGTSSLSEISEARKVFNQIVELKKAAQ